MNTKALLTLVIAVAIFGSLATAKHAQPSAKSTSNTNAPVFTSDGQLQLPSNYREWVYLTTGFDMSYSAQQNADHHMFDNIFVNPEAYQSFLKTGTWPDKTMIVLEVRGAKSKGSINQAGNFQDSDIMGLEVHIKDTSRFKDQGNWAFFGFDGEAVPAPGDDPYAKSSGAKTASNATSKMTLTSASCYSCHAQHAAVDTTFVQFYPTLLPIAKNHSTLSTLYLKDPSTPTEK